MRWTGPAVACLAACALATLACRRSGVTPEEVARARRGREVYSFEGCASCHGAQRQGTRNAPPLTAVRRHWSADELASYLRQPAAYPKDGRLQRVAERFPAEMAGLPAADAGRLRDLVAYLLSP